MTHNTEDELLGFALETIASEEERVKIAAHLELCSECSAKLEKLRNDIAVLGSVRPAGGQMAPHDKAPLLPRGRSPWQVLARHNPLQSELANYAILRNVALVALGIFVGLGISKEINREPEFVSSAYVSLLPPGDSLKSYTASDATAVPANYYEQLLEKGK